MPTIEMKAVTMILAGDIGGTKTLLALFTREAGPREPLVELSFSSSEFASLDVIVQRFLATHPAPITAACFGVAGPVMAGRAAITNLPWVIEERTLSQTLGGATVALINDLQAFAQSIPYLQSHDIATLSPGEPVTGGAIAVIAPGTGLGEAFLTSEQGHYRAHPSEGGHASFAPTNPTEAALLSYLLEHYSHVSYERVCSGIGIPNIYRYFRDRVFNSETAHIAARLAESADPTPIIVAGALDPATPCPICSATLDCFLGILGNEAGNLALKVLATGGVYLGGGIPPRLLPQLRDGALLEAMRNKGRFRDLLARMPVHVILNPKAAIYGAAAYALMG